MTAITSNAVTGNWSAGGSWVGGVAPGNGDTATIVNGAVITATASLTVGHSPGAADATKAVTINSGGSLIINAGVVFTCRGDFLNSASNSVRSLTMNAGAIFEFDASAAGVPATARYTMTNPSQYPGSQPCLLISGSSGTRCAFRSNVGGANGRIAGGAVNYFGLVDCQFCDFLRIGDATNDAWAFRANSDGSDADSSKFRFVNCTFDACAAIVSDQAMGPYAKFTMQNNTFKNSVGATYNLSFSAYNDKAGALSVRLVDGCVFDKSVLFQAPRDVTITNNYFGAALVTSDTDSEGWAAWDENFLRITSTNNTVNMFGLNSTDTFVFVDDAAYSNQHSIQIGAYETVATQIIDGFIFEQNGNDGTGDCILIGTPSSAVAFTIQNCIVLPNTAGECTGTLFSALGNINCTITANHNTFIIGTGGGAAVGETYAGHAGMLASFRSNLAWDTSARGYKLFDSGADNTVSDLVTSANANYNGGINFVAGSNLKGYNNLEFSAGSPGANDVAANPNFFDSARDIAKWDLSLGGPGTAANALTELKKRNESGFNTSYTVTNLLAYIRAGFSPTNVAFDGTAHDGGDIGAVAYTPAAASGQSGAMMLLGIGG